MPAAFRMLPARTAAADPAERPQRAGAALWAQSAVLNIVIELRAFLTGFAVGAIVASTFWLLWAYRATKP